MLLSSLITTAEESHGSTSVFSPVVVGAISLGILLVLLVGLLVFGKGREHS
jgi:hypothetical protein